MTDQRTIEEICGSSIFDEGYSPLMECNYSEVVKYCPYRKELRFDTPSYQIDRFICMYSFRKVMPDIELERLR